MAITPITAQEIQQLRAATKGTDYKLHFNNAGASLPPDIVVETVVGYLQEEALQGGYETELNNKHRLEEVYTLIAQLVNAQKDEIAIVENASTAWWIAFSGVGFNKGDEVITCEYEYVTNLIGLLHAQKTYGITVKLVPNDDNGNFSPQLIEMQGFPSLFAFQVLQDEVTRKYFNIPDNFSAYLNGMNKASYLSLLHEIIVANHKPEEVILLELLPHQQKTRIDFYCTEEYLGIKTVCLTELIKEGNDLFYLLKGVKTRVKRIYNRIIFDDLQQQSKEIQEKGKILLEDLDVEWVPHPNWFYLLSKYTLPFLNHPSVPKTWFLNTLMNIPEDLENYVLKPLFSFSGQGVIIDVTKEDIQAIIDPKNWILQRKVKYAEVIKTPNVPAKAEIRVFYFWKEGAPRPIAAFNLGRLSKGKMIGVRYNKDNDWVGGTIVYFEK